MSSARKGGNKNTPKPTPKQSIQQDHGPKMIHTEPTQHETKLSFVEDTIEDDDGNIIEIDTSVQQIGIAKAKKKVKSGGFQGMDLAPEVYAGVKRMGFNVPTPIQRQAIPILLEGADVVAMARTGSGKTAAFTIPMLHRLATSKGLMMGSRGVRAVVLSPTRELAQQTHHVIQQIGKSLNYRIVMLIGGQSMQTQFELLSNSPDIIVATPGRLVHHLIEVEFSLQSVEFVCFDEADRLFEMGFAQQLYEILKRMNENRQTCLFSATMPQALIEFSRAGLKSPVSVRLDSEGKLSPDLQVSFFNVKTNEKTAALLFILRNVLPKTQQAMVFVATRHHVDFLVQLLNFAGINSTGIYGLMDADGRIENIDSFKKKETRVLVVTDLAARGIDIPLLDNVIHYDFPTQPKLFIHRSGRVARAGSKGIAFTLVSPEDMPFVIDLFLFFAWKLPFQLPEDKKSITNTTSQPTQSLLTNQTKDNKNNNDNFDHNDDDDDVDSKLIEKEPDMDRLVDFGLIPTSLLDFEVEYCSSLIKSNDLERLLHGCANAYEKYSKTKGTASAASVKKWRNIRGLHLPNVIDIHPWFVRQLNETSDNTQHTTVMNVDGTKSTIVHNPNSIKSMILAERAKDLLSGYTPQQTIFELNNKEVDVIQQKRLLHDRVIVTKHGLREVVGNKAASKYEAEQEAYALEHNIQSTVVKPQHTIKVVVKQGSMGDKKITVTVADRRKRKTLDDKYKKGTITMQQYINGLKELPQHLQQNPIAIESVTNTNITNRINIGPKQTQNNNQGTMTDVVDLNASISRSDRPPMLSLLPKGPTKRSLQPLNNDEQTSTTTTMSKPQQSLSRAEILKQLAASVSDELSVTTSDGNQSEIIQVTKKKKRGQLTADERKDTNFISLAPSGNRYEELGLSIGNTRLEDMALELHAEDGEGQRIQQKTRKWNEHSKKFVTIYSSKDAFGKVVTNEAGQKVNKDYVPGQLYSEWRTKYRKLEQVVDMDDDDNNTGGRKKPLGKRIPRSMLKSIDDDDKGGKKHDFNNKSKRPDFKNGRKFDDGIKSATDLLKQKRAEIKSRQEDKKGFERKKGAMRGGDSRGSSSRGGGRGGSRGGGRGGSRGGRR